MRALCVIVSLCALLMTGCGVDLGRLCTALPGYVTCTATCAVCLTQVVDAGGIPSDPDQINCLIQCGECAAAMGIDLYDMAQELQDVGPEGMSCPLEPDEPQGQAPETIVPAEESTN